MKLFFHVALLLVTLFFWKGFADKGKEMEEIRERLEIVEDQGDP